MKDYFLAEDLKDTNGDPESAVEILRVPIHFVYCGTSFDPKILAAREKN